MPNGNKVGLYARVSTDLQATGLEAQVRAMHEHCRMNGITEVELFSDENQSGAKSSRPALGRGDAKVVEHPDAIKAYLVRQENVKIDLTKLAKLRFIENYENSRAVWGLWQKAVRHSSRYSNTP